MSSQDIIHNSKQEIHASFRIKSAAVSLFVILSIGVYFVAKVISLLPSDQAVPSGALGLLISTSVLVIIVESALQIVLFIGAGKIEDRTKRDERIAALSTRNAYYLLVVGIFASVGSMLLGYSAFEITSIMLIAFLLAETVSYASQLIYYQRLS